MKRVLLAIVLTALAAPVAHAQDNAVSAAKKYVTVLLQKDYQAALKLLTPRMAKMGERNLEMLARIHTAPGPGVSRVDIGEVLFSLEMDDTALVILAAQVSFVTGQLEGVRAKLESGRDEDFPQDQRAAARKVIRIAGGAWIAPWPVYLHREVRKKTSKTDDGEPMDTVVTFGPWQIDPKGESFPFKEYRGDLKRKLGANILRYAGEDLGDPGCRDAKSPGGGCYAGEDAAPSRCTLSATGKPCPADFECLWPGGDEPVACKPGQKGCMSADAQACVVR